MEQINSVSTFQLGFVEKGRDVLSGLLICLVGIRKGMLGKIRKTSGGSKKSQVRKTQRRGILILSDGYLRNYLETNPGHSQDLLGSLFSNIRYSFMLKMIKSNKPYTNDVNSYIHYITSIEPVQRVLDKVIIYAQIKIDILL